MKNATGFIGSPPTGLKPRFQVFLATGTFYPSEALIRAGGVVYLDLRGSGGGGATASTGGAGGGGQSRWQGFVTIPSTAPITVTLGASAAANADGSSSTFGSLATANGGKKGLDVMAGLGGSQGLPGGQPNITANQPGGNGGGEGGGVGYAYNAGQAALVNSGAGGAGGSATGVGGASGSGYCLVTWWE